MRSIVTIASISLLASCSAPADTQRPVFELAPFSPLVVGRGSGSLVLADLNRDGHLDLVTQHLLQETVNVLIGDGKGKFAPAADSPMKLGYQPGTIALGDVNSDGVPDLAVAHKNAGGEFVSIFLGDGKSGFKHSLGSPLRVSDAMEFYKPSLRLVDVNEDAKLDIVAANGRRHTIEILIGDGTGRFAAGPVLTLGSGAGVSSFAVGDADGDGHVDLVAASGAGPDSGNLGPWRVVIQRGDGKGNFADAARAPMSLPPGAVLQALADVNGDDRLDIVISHGDRNVVSVLVNDANGAFASTLGAPLKLEGQAFAVTVADVNGDGKGDLIATAVQSGAAPFDSRLVVFLGDGSGFVPAPGSPFPAGSGAYNLAVGDIDADGRLDVATSSFEGDAVTILLGRAAPARRPTRTVHVTPRTFPMPFAPAS